MNLDDPGSFHQYDVDGMLAYIRDLPEQLHTAWSYAQSIDLPGDPEDIRHIVICGMGGSSISGELLTELIRPASRVPIEVNRTYELPGYVTGPATLVVALSHSGNTEETLSSVVQALERGARVLAITTGGQLAEIVQEAGETAALYSYPSLPRAALGWLYGMLLALLVRLEIVPELEGDVIEAVELLRKGNYRLGVEMPVSRNPSKRLAGQLVGRIPVTWGAGILSPVARRWKTQINENAKTAAYFEILPELNHNTVVGLEYPDAQLRHLCVVQLMSAEHNHPRVLVRHQASFELLLQEAVMVDKVTAQGKSRLAQQFSLIQFGDYVSYYLAMAYGVDPSPIPTIDALKQRLSEVD
nr:bifunctional phosphoglucose/phosphomannose isomerase [Anaerolineae bacterium]